MSGCGGRVCRMFRRVCFLYQAEDGIRDWSVTGVQTCALPISPGTQNVTVNGASVVGINFTATSQGQTFSVSGTISPAAGGSGATVTLSGAASATTTDRKSTRLNSSH